MINEAVKGWVGGFLLDFYLYLPATVDQFFDFAFFFFSLYPIYIYRERETERETERDKERETEREAEREIFSLQLRASSRLDWEL